MGEVKEAAIHPSREEDYSEWYQQIVKAAELAENSPTRGCMVIKPWGWGIWENIQRELDDRFKKTGHENAYFPLLIPLSLMEREASHVKGFAKECAVVTHHRLEEKGGKLIPTGELEEPLVVRPTSETIIGETYAKWVQSYRDLPLLINQWANVVRWEMRPRVFLRTAEFLWQEGHTVHASEQEARQEVTRMLEVYREVAEDVLAMPVICGEKPESERFPGAVATLSIEAMMQDRKALQSGTSHYLGQHFSKAFNIRFLNPSGELEYAYTTSWGVSTRLIGGVIMTHGDDDGLRVPPLIAPKQVVILPVVPKPEAKEEVFRYADELESELSQLTFKGRPLRVFVDKREMRGGEKNWLWIKRGAPVRIEVGPRDIKSQDAVIYRRDHSPREKMTLSRVDLRAKIVDILVQIQQNMFTQAKSLRSSHLQRDLKDFEEFKAFFTPKNSEKPEIHGGFVLAKWSGDPESEKLLEDLKVSIRCLPLEQSGTKGKCILSGKDATLDAVFAKSY